MKCKSICFCIRGHSKKSKENEVEELEKVSHVKASNRGRTKGVASTIPAGDGAGNNVDGTNTIASTDAGVAVAVVTSAHVSLMSVTEGQDGSGRGQDHGHCHDHGGESGADGGG
ncbi:uncharacterized protein LOC113848359 [Abrus precatorius]|uniref:Uncharacterized protein LOC113848359 n=1 Tax=Abrus precatorius TaxID=3816 RepID=A0A8B8JQR2_ABRPR|nr:uncharacterized protein LOC113848359 [Abrus precatorius]